LPTFIVDMVGVEACVSMGHAKECAHAQYEISARSRYLQVATSVRRACTGRWKARTHAGSSAVSFTMASHESNKI